MTIMSNLSQTPSANRTNALENRNFKNMSSKKKSDFIKEMLSSPSIGRSSRNEFYKLKSINEVSYVDPSSPRFDAARKRLRFK